jgi:TonB-linked SusC/RagA family outer membrane protein
MNQSLPMRRSILFRKNATGHLLTKPHLLMLLFFCFFSIFAMAQQRITGKITSGDSSVAGATVQVKGTNTFTTTDPSGNFSIDASPNATLVISSIGFGSQEVRVNNRTSVTVALQRREQELEQVVVVGYGTQKKATLTGSISTVSGNDVAKSPSPNIANSLQGRLPGLIANQRNGTPGRDNPTITIRGGGSLAGYNDVLIVVDGVPRGDMGRLNAQDIESFSILKDASAAIYGAAGANGVILVTTKSGSRGKTDFSVSYNYAINSPTKVPDVLDAATYAEVYNEGVFYRSGRNPNYTPQYTAAQIQKYRDGSDPILNPNTDWVGLTLHDSYLQTIDFQANGGTDKVRYLLSFGSMKQNGNFYGNTMLYKQYNARARVDIEVVKNLTVGANINAIFKNGDYPGGGNDGNIQWANILGANPTIVGKYPNGLLGPGRLGQSSLLNDQRGYVKNTSNPVYSTFTAGYVVPFIKGLRFDGSFNYDFSSEFNKDWQIPYYYHEYNTQTGNYDRLQGTGLSNAQLTDGYNRWSNRLTNVRTTYERTFQNTHHVMAMVGWEQSLNKWSGASATRRNFLSPSIDQLNQGSIAAADQGTSGSAWTNSSNNYFGRLNYDFRSKYLFEFLFRLDGSWKFPSGDRYGFFPGASVGWRLSEEDFIKEALPFVNQLKLRATYGELGNYRFPSSQDWSHLQSFLLGQNYVFGTVDAPGIYSAVLPNPTFTWEESQKLDFGLEALLWNGKLGVEFTYWIQRRTNILAQRSLSVPNTFGFPNLPVENFGKVNSHGLELALTSRGNITRDLSYNINGNIAYNTNKVVYLDEVPPARDYQAVTGKPIATNLYYIADGIFNDQAELNAYPHHANSQVGDIKVVDYDKNNIIDANDRVRLPYSTVPKYVFGLTSDFQFKNFDLNIFFQGQAGVRNYDDQAAALGGQDFTNASVWRAKDRWSPTNPNGSMPRADAWQPGNTSFFLFNAAFVRLKTVELGYSIPVSILQKTKAVRSLRLYVSAFNLATWAKDIKFADPEFSGSYFNYPPARVINFGASIKF